MRSGRTAGNKWDPGQLVGGVGGHQGVTTGYSSSEDDEMTRLKPTGNSGTNTSGGSSSGHGGGGHRPSRPARTNYRQHSNSEGATSPNESDNTYAEASLLQQTTSRAAPADQHQIHQQRGGPIRYGQYNPSFRDAKAIT